jgi:hypothetical protein
MCNGVNFEQFQNMFETTNERQAPTSESQTNNALLYEFSCANSTTLRLLDSPGFADTRGVEKDEEHRAGILEQIKHNLKTIDAVIVVANGTQERLGVATNYTVQSIAAMFPRSIASNVGFLFTNVGSALNFNFEMDSLPTGFQNAEYWTLQNPLALWNKYKAKVNRGAFREEQKRHFLAEVREGFETGISTLNELFGWLDSRESQPIKGIMDLYHNMSQIDVGISNLLSRLDTAEEQRCKIAKLSFDLATGEQVNWS